VEDRAVADGREGADADRVQVAAQDGARADGRAVEDVDVAGEDGRGCDERAGREGGDARTEGEQLALPAGSRARKGGL
jgi:hypothetical protein